MMNLLVQAVFITMAIILITEFRDGNPLIKWLVLDQSGEYNTGKIADDVKYQVRKIGKTLYKITSKYEKGKTLTEKFEKIIEREIKK